MAATKKKAIPTAETRSITPLYRYVADLRRAKGAAETLASQPHDERGAWVDASEPAQLGALIADAEFRMMVAILSMGRDPERCPDSLPVGVALARAFASRAVVRTYREEGTEFRVVPLQDIPTADLGPDDLTSPARIAGFCMLEVVPDRTTQLSRVVTQPDPIPERVVMGQVVTPGQSSPSGSVDAQRRKREEHDMQVRTLMANPSLVGPVPVRPPHKRNTPSLRLEDVGQPASGIRTDASIDHESRRRFAESQTKRNEEKAAKDAALRSAVLGLGPANGEGQGA